MKYVCSNKSCECCINMYLKMLELKNKDVEDIESALHTSRMFIVLASMIGFLLGITTQLLNII